AVGRAGCGALALADLSQPSFYPAGAGGDMLDAVYMGGHPVRARRLGARCDRAGACGRYWAVRLPANEAGGAAARGAGSGAGAWAAWLARSMALVAGGAGAGPAVVAVCCQHTTQPRQRRALAADRDQSRLNGRMAGQLVEQLHGLLPAKSVLSRRWYPQDRP